MYFFTNFAFPIKLKSLLLIEFLKQYKIAFILFEDVEETNAILDISDAELVYKGYTADQRNTDHAWLETAAYHFHIDENKRNILVNTIVAADDACKVKLIIADDSNPDYKFMYGGHYDFVNPVVQKLKQKNVVNNSSKGFLSWLFGF